MDNSNDLNDLMRQLKELKELRASMDVSAKNISKKEKINTLKEKTKRIEKSKNLTEVLNKQIEDLDDKIGRVESDLIKTAKEYDEAYKKLQEIIDEEDKKLDSNILLNKKQIEEIRNYYEILKEKENARSLEIKEAFDVQKKLLTSLKSKKTKLKKDLLNAEALGLSLKDYNEINSTLRKTTIFYAIVDRKGLTDIISKDRNERTEEDKQKLKEAKEEIMREISEAKKEKSSSVIDIIQALYSLDISYEKVKPRVMYMPINEFNYLKDRASKLPIIYVGDKYDESKEASKAPKDLENIKDNNNQDVDVNSNINERIVIFKDKDNGDLYIREYAREKFRDKFKINKNEKGIKIKGSLCFKISEDEANYIMENANNNFSPYITKIDEIEISKKEYTADDFNITNEEFNLLVDKGLVPGTDEFTKAIEDKASFVEEFKKDVSNITDFVDEVKNDIQSDNPFVYGNNEEDSVFVQEKEELKKESSLDRLFVQSEEEKNISSLVDDLTEGLDINEEDVQRYIASNIKVTKEFKEELKEGNVSYNIIHIGVSIIKTPINFFKKITSKLLLSFRGQQMMDKVNIRLDKLSDTELELLSDLEKDNPIYPLIINKIEERKNKTVVEESNEIIDMFDSIDEEEKVKQR